MINVTTLEQSKLLKAWGVPQDTDFYHIWLDGDRGNGYSEWYELMHISQEYCHNIVVEGKGSGDEGDFYAAYSLEELIGWLGDDLEVLRNYDHVKQWCAEARAGQEAMGKTLLAAVFALAQAVKGEQQ